MHGCSMLGGDYKNPWLDRSFDVRMRGCEDVRVECTLLLRFGGIMIYSWLDFESSHE